VTLDEMIVEVRREIRMREGVYPAWMARRRLKPENAELYMRRMRAVLVMLERIRNERIDDGQRQAQRDSGGAETEQGQGRAEH
jgi:hypothetical protein